MVKARQGDICWVIFGSPKDSGPCGKRPAVVVQNDLLNKSNIQTTVVALITSNRKLAKVPGNVILKKGSANLPKTSVVVVSQMATVDKGRLLEKIGTLTHELRKEIIEGCRWVIKAETF